MKILIKRGTQANIEAATLDVGEPAFSTDTEILYIGTSTGKVQLPKVDLSNVDDSVLLNKIKNVDGSGSGLDSDLLDGREGSEYALNSRFTISSNDPSGGNDGDLWFKV